MDSPDTSSYPVDPIERRPLPGRAGAGRMKLISPEEALAALRQFRSEWESFHRLPVTENTVTRGDALAWEHQLRGYDAIHLACALIWGETLGLPVTVASFDGQLLEAARNEKMDCRPSEK